MAYEDIKPTLIVGAHFEEQEPYERTDKVSVTVSVSNTGRRSATDVVIRVDRGDECGVYEHSPVRIEPGYRAVPWFEECEHRPPGGMIRVDVTSSKKLRSVAIYKWDGQGMVDKIVQHQPDLPSRQLRDSRHRALLIGS